MAALNLPKFVLVSTLAKYQAITSKDANTLYFVADTHQIFKGSELYTNGVEFVTSVPEASACVRGIIYVNTNNACAYVYDGTTVRRIGTVMDSTIIEANTNDANGATIGAIKTYVADKDAAVSAALHQEVVDEAAARTTAITNASSTLNAAIVAEVARAEAAEETITSAVNAVSSALNAADVANSSALNSAIVAETARASAAESAIADDVSELTTTVANNSSSLNAAIVAEAERAASAEAELETMITDLGAGIHFKGFLANKAALEAKTGMEAGDIYIVQDNGTDSDGNPSTDQEYLYDGTTWLALGDTLDLSGYATDDDLAALATTVANNSSALNAADVANSAALHTEVVNASSALNAAVVAEAARAAAEEEALSDAIAAASSALNAADVANSAALHTEVVNASSALNAAKADKVSGAVSGDLAGLDANGNLTDTGVKVGGATLAASPASTTVATEAAVAAVKSALETFINTQDATKLDKFSGTNGNIVVVGENGSAVADGGIKAGTSAFAGTPDATTLATEAGVKKYIEDNVTGDLENAMTKVDAGNTGKVLIAAADGDSDLSNVYVGGTAIVNTDPTTNANLATEAAVINAFAWQNI